MFFNQFTLFLFTGSLCIKFHHPGETGPSEQSLRLFTCAAFFTRHFFVSCSCFGDLSGSGMLMLWGSLPNFILFRCQD